MTIDFKAFASPPSYALDWAALGASYDWIRRMAETPQDPIHHAEGDVLTHTRMVCEAITRLSAWAKADEATRSELLAAALFHDVSKPETTRIEAGRVSARGHSTRGDVRCRQILWSLGVDPHARERVASLVRYHQIPFFLVDSPDAARVAFRVSQSAICRNLAALAEADVHGRLCSDARRMLDNVSLFSEFCGEHDCFDGPRAFPPPHSRVLYFRRTDRDPAYHAFDDTRCEVTVMSGLPGAGKDTWIKAHAANLPVVSLDSIRRRLKISPSAEQGAVVTEAREQARRYLRSGSDFVWNATNLSRQIRERALSLFFTYNARVRIVYVESPARLLMRRNSEREHPVPERVLRSMMNRWELPDATEAHTIVRAIGE